MKSVSELAKLAGVEPNAWMNATAGGWFPGEKKYSEPDFPLYSESSIEAMLKVRTAELEAKVAELENRLLISNRLLKEDLQEMGSCDHSVGICVCEWVRCVQDNNAAMRQEWEIR